MDKDMDALAKESLYRLETLFAYTRDDFKDLKQRLAMIESGQANAQSAQVEVLLAGLGGRLGQLDERLHRIEHRLGLVLEQLNSRNPHSDTPSGL